MQRQKNLMHFFDGKEIFYSDKIVKLVNLNEYRSLLSAVNDQIWKNNESFVLFFRCG